MKKSIVTIATPFLVLAIIIAFLSCSKKSNPINSKNHAPVLDSIGRRSVDEGSNLSFRVHATDADGDSIVLSATNIPINATFIDSGNGAGSFNFSPDYTQLGVYNVTFKATDPSSVVDSEVVQITVNLDQEGLVAFWALDEGIGNTVGDASGNNLNGTAYGATIVSGMVGNAREFDGVNDYIEVPDNNLLDINDSITIMMWVMLDPSDAEGFLISKRLQNDIACEINYSIKYGFTPGHNYLSFQFGTGCATGSNYALTDVPGLSEGNWHHLAISFRFGDPTSARWVIDGQVRPGTWTHWDGSPGGGTEIPPTNSYNLEVGRQLSTSPGYMKGALDQIRIYNRALY